VEKWLATAYHQPVRDKFTPLCEAYIALETENARLKADIANLEHDLQVLGGVIVQHRPDGA
jgi:hypothetical protein